MSAVVDSFFTADPALLPLLRQALAPADVAAAMDWLEELGAQAAQELDALAITADRNTPVLHQWDRTGERVDRIEHHPAFDRLNQVAFEEHGFAAMSHRPGVHGWNGTVPHALKYALCYEFVQAEFGLFCPISMTDSAARLLRKAGGPEHTEYVEALTSTDPDRRVTGAMFMTEQQGGSDVGKTATQAVLRDGEWFLTGRKWFCSNPTAEVIMTLARVPGGPEGTKGLGLFLVPRHRPGGALNGLRIDRLKDKLGARSFASAEVTLEDCYAIPVGPLESGFRTMTEMVNSSRLSNAVRSAGLMRRAVTSAVEFAREREAFGRPLFDAPLMRQTLLPLVVTAEAALALTMLTAVSLQASDAGEELGRAQARVLTPLAKLVITKRARQVVSEALEVRGGNGYIEEWPEARLLRDAHLGSIWEGSSNIIALDVLRATRTGDNLSAVHELGTDRLRTVDRADPDLVTLSDRAGERLDAAVVRIQKVADARDEPSAVDAATALADALAACELVATASAEVRAGHGYRVAMVAALFLASDVGLLSLPASRPVATNAGLEHLDVLASGGSIDSNGLAALMERRAG